MPNLFPEEFADLEAVGGPWSVGSYDERYGTRLGSSMEEMVVFYDAVFPRAHEILAYCDRFDIRQPPEQVRALMNMLYWLIVVSFPVETWKRARAPDGGARPSGMAAARETAVLGAHPKDALIRTVHTYTFGKTYV